MKTSFILLIFFGLTSCKSTVKTDQSASQIIGNPKFAIQEEIHNFGTVQTGELVSYSFKFSNTGNRDLVIKNIEVDCGCLRIEYPKEAVKSGDYNYIEVLFDSAGEVGKVLKEVRIYTNAGEKAISLIVTANVENELFNLYK